MSFVLQEQPATQLEASALKTDLFSPQSSVLCFVRCGACLFHFALLILLPARLLCVVQALRAVEQYVFVGFAT